MGKVVNQAAPEMGAVHWLTTQHEYKAGSGFCMTLVIAKKMFFIELHCIASK